MRVLFCKIHCPFICFCKPSVAAAAHLYTTGPLKLENSPYVPPPSTTTTLPNSHEHEAASASCNGETIEFKDDSLYNVNKNNEQQENAAAAAAIKSCIRKAPNDVGKKRVQWMDNLGKQLVQIKEFESCETGDTDYYEEDNRGCICAIL